MSGKIVRIIDSKGLGIEPGDYELQSILTGELSRCVIEKHESGIDLDIPFSDSWYPIWFLEDNNVTFVIL